MTDELKWGLLVSVSIIAIALIGMKGCERSMRIEQEAPIVETCIKHPATVSPFRGNY